MTNRRSWVALVWLLLAMGIPGTAAFAQTSTGQAIDLSPDAEGFQIWYTINADGLAVGADDIVMGASIGQPIAGAPNPVNEEAWVTAGFWAPGVCYDTTDVDASDSTDVEPVAVAGIEDLSMNAFALAPVWPNPCHGVAYIGWAVPRASIVRLTAVDVQGRQVATLADGNYPAGRYGVKWNARTGNTPSSGIYFIRLETPDGVFTRRVAIIH